jgi:hypothetical protein
MRTKEEIKQLSNKWAIDNADRTMESNSALNKGYINGYTQCQEDILSSQSQEPKQREVSEFDWNELRDSFFFNCTTFKEAKKNNTLCRVNIAPHDLFEWFKDNLFKSKTK